MAATYADRLSYPADEHKFKIDPSDHGSVCAFLRPGIALGIKEIEKQQKEDDH